MIDHWVGKNALLSGICCRILNLSRTEWKRKLRERAIDFGKNGELSTLFENIIITDEGYYEVRFGKHRYLGIVIPEPWYIGLWLQFAAAWNKTRLRNIKLL